MSATVRVVVFRGERVEADADIAVEAATTFIMGCHFSLPDVAIYVEGELIDAAELAAQLQQAAMNPELAAAPPTATQPIQLDDFKTFTELMHASLAALTKLQIETFDSFAASSRQLFDEQMKHMREFAKECSDQRRQHRQALSEIDTFDRGTHVAIAAEQAAFRAGQFGGKKPEPDGLTASDIITGFGTMGGASS